VFLRSRGYIVRRARGVTAGKTDCAFQEGPARVGLPRGASNLRFSDGGCGGTDRTQWLVWLLEGRLV